MKHDHYMSILAKLSTSLEKVAGARISSCVVLKNNILSFGFNKRKSHPFQAKFGKNEECIFLHAEIDAIKNALKCTSVEDLQRSTLYIYRSKKVNGVETNGLAKPCVGCMRAIVSFNIKNVVYSTDDGYATL
jgi:deoxycytidylate deaminase